MTAEVAKYLKALEAVRGKEQELDQASRELGEAERNLAEVMRRGERRAFYGSDGMYFLTTGGVIEHAYLHEIARNGDAVSIGAN